MIYNDIIIKVINYKNFRLLKLNYTTTIGSLITTLKSSFILFSFMYFVFAFAFDNQNKKKLGTFSGFGSPHFVITEILFFLNVFFYSRSSCFFCTFNCVMTIIIIYD